MNFPHPNRETNPAEYQKMMSQFRRRRRIEDAIAISVAIAGVYGLYCAIGFIARLF